jgi:hypothetical protein
MSGTDSWGQVNVKASLVKAAHGEKAFRKAQTLLQAPPTGQVWKSYHFQGSTRLALRLAGEWVGNTWDDNGNQLNDVARVFFSPILL